MNFAEHLAADQRLVLVRLLADAPAFKQNSSVLAMQMDHLGWSMSRDAVKGHLAWLAEQGLVANAEPIPGLFVATLSARGFDVAKGRAVVPGVARLAP